MYKVLKKPTFILAVLIAFAFVSNAGADAINFTSGIPGTSTYQDVSGSITAGNGTVTITLNNDLTNTQVFNIAQNISGIYFTVSGYSGTSSVLSSFSTQSTSISGKNATLQGAVSPTGWTTVNNVAGGLGLCVICPGGNPAAGPEQTIIGGSGSGYYANVKGSINDNAPHNPFLVGPVTFTLSVAGVTAESTFNNVVVQFGTTAQPPTTVPDSSSVSLLVVTSIGIGLVLRRRSRHAG